MGLFFTNKNSKCRPICRPKPEVHISQLVYKIATPFKRYNPHFLGPEMVLFRKPPDVTGSPKSKMAAVKPELLTYLLPV